jgi:hypothetical protein
MVPENFFYMHVVRAASAMRSGGVRSGGEVHGCFERGKFPHASTSEAIPDCSATPQLLHMYVYNSYR